MSTPGNVLNPLGTAGVAGISAADASIVIGGTATHPTIATGRLDQIATLHSAAAPVTFNLQKGTNLAGPTATSDAARAVDTGQTVFGNITLTAGQYTNAGGAHAPGISRLGANIAAATPAIVMFGLITDVGGFGFPVAAIIGVLPAAMGFAKPTGGTGVSISGISLNGAAWNIVIDTLGNLNIQASAVLSGDTISLDGHIYRP